MRQTRPDLAQLAPQSDWWLVVVRAGQGRNNNNQLVTVTTNLRLLSLPSSTRTNLLTSRYIWGFIDYMMLWQYTWSHTIYWNLANQYRNTRLHSNNYNRLTLHNVTRGISKLLLFLLKKRFHDLSVQSVRPENYPSKRNVKLDLTTFPNATVVWLVRKAYSRSLLNLSCFSWRFRIRN